MTIVENEVEKIEGTPVADVRDRLRHVALSKAGNPEEEITTPNPTLSLITTGLVSVATTAEGEGLGIR